VQFVAEKLSEQDLARGFCREIGVTRSDPSSRDATRALRELESQLDAAGRRHARVHGELRAVGGGIRVVGSHGSQGSRRFERSLIALRGAADAGALADEAAARVILRSACNVLPAPGVPSLRLAKRT